MLLLWMLLLLLLMIVHVDLEKTKYFVSVYESFALQIKFQLQ